MAKKKSFEVIKLDLKEEVKNAIEKVDRDYMLAKCKLFKVRHSKNDSFLDLLLKYHYKSSRMKPWEIPDDEAGVTGFISPDFMLDDAVIVYKVFDMNYKLTKNEKYKKNRDRQKKEIVKMVTKFIDYYERQQLFDHFFKK